METRIGVRVVRGHDWKWHNQDGGIGRCGTVVEIGKKESITTPEKTVVVQWDSGSRTNYRIGYQNSYDLLLLDNAPTGVRHPNVTCNSCKKHGICGMRWKCLSCQGIDLCTICYMSDKHDVNHPFARFETQSSIGVELTKRSAKSGTKIQARGIFAGARVVRGYDWEWGNQDGGEGKFGKVMDIRGWDNESKGSVANVLWSSGSTNVYRIGHRGKVDLKYVADAPGHYYYPDHLPILGQNIEPFGYSAPSRGASSISPPFSNRSCQLLNVGDKIKVIIEDVNELKALQEGHGGWNQRMSEFIGHVGTVHRITDRGDIRVQFENCQNRWTFNPIALTKVISYSIGDIVRICDDPNKVRELQKSHGEWIDLMRNALGKMGKIYKVYADGDLRVTVDGQTWTFNPQCVSLIPGSETEMNNTMISHPSREENNPRFGNLLERQSLPNVHETKEKTVDNGTVPSAHNDENIVRDSAQGKVESVKDMIQRNPQSVDTKSSGKTSLQVASHQGHVEIVSLLLSNDADINLKDDEGDTALHYAAFGNQPQIIQLLLEKGADADSINNGKCSALHIAANKGHVNCARILINHGCNVNLQDSYGDTALHDAIGKTDNLEIIDSFISLPCVDFTLKNRRGFNILHHAALKGNNYAAEKIITKSRQLVDCKKEDGFAALHLASLNGHHNVVETLINQGQADVNIVNNRKQTPLHLAVSQGHCSIIELLVSHGANVNQTNEDNDSSLHAALMKCNDKSRTDSTTNVSAAINNLLTQLSSVCHRPSLNLAIACFLITEGNGDINLKNRKEKTPLDLLEMLKESDSDTANYNQIKEFILQLYDTRNARRHQPMGTLPSVTTNLLDDASALSQSVTEQMTSVTSSNDTPHEDHMSQEQSECIICCEFIATVVFEPCGHQIACEECCSRMKKCIKCGEIITVKVIKGVKIDSNHKDFSGNGNGNGNKKVSIDRLMYLETRINEMEEANSCTICMERVKNVVFLCGHGACANCAQTLKICHMCRKSITKKINLY